jgi:hypothetical protein
MTEKVSAARRLAQERISDSGRGLIVDGVQYGLQDGDSGSPDVLHLYDDGTLTDANGLVIPPERRDAEIAAAREAVRAKYAVAAPVVASLGYDDDDMDTVDPVDESAVAGMSTAEVRAWLRANG